MRKIYLLATTLMASATLFGQTNLSFEDWDQGSPVDWNTPFAAAPAIGDVTDGTDPVMPVEEGTDAPVPDGASYLKLTSFNLDDSQNAQVPDGDYGSFAIQTFASTSFYDTVGIAVRYDLVGSDEAAVVVQGFDANDDLLTQGLLFLDGTETAWQDVGVQMNIIEVGDVVEYDIVIVSSAAQIFNDPSLPAIQPGSQIEVDNIRLGNTIDYVDNVENVVAVDLDQNCDGSDLRVNFDVPADESNVDKYYLAVFETPWGIGNLADPEVFAVANGIEITPDGTNQEYTFSETDVAWTLNAAGDGFEANQLADEVEYRVFVLVVSNDASLQNSFASSNDITIECQYLSILDIDKNNMKVYPNPASSNINFDFGNNVVETITVSSINGQNVATINPSASEASLDVTGLENGVYFFNAVDNAGNIVRTDKFVVSH